MNSTSKKAMMRELETCNNIQEAFEILADYYDLKNCRPGSITKAAFINKLPDTMQLLGAKPRKEHA